MSRREIPARTVWKTARGDFLIGCSKTFGTFTEGLVDDVRIYSQAMAEEDLQVVMAGVEGGFPLAMRPAPADGSQYEQTWASLRWTPGDWAVSHDLYFGTAFADVNEGAEGTLVGNLAIAQQVVGFPGFPAPQGLEPGTTYYWRVDEVNDADPNSPWKGNVWSFWIPPKSGYDPIPADGGRFADPNVDLSWTAGLRAVMEAVYFGTDADEVANAAGAPPVTGPTFDPGTLAWDTTHYWRVDTFDGLEWTKGEVWSFQTKPDIPIADPDLLCWWMVDEGQGTVVLDWSGHGNEGTITGEPQWVDGFDGRALNFNGAGDDVTANFTAVSWPAWTMAVWCKSDELGQDNNSSMFATSQGTGGGFQFSYDPDNNYRYHSDIDFNLGRATTAWVHLAVSYDGTIARGYYNGEFVGTFTPSSDDLTHSKLAIGVNRAVDNWFDGSVDELRVYTKALTQEEIELAMRIDPLLAWNSHPMNGATPDIDNATPLSWSRGDSASSHEVYLGLDKNAVANADTSDTAGIYRGRQNGTSYTPPEGVEWGGGPYYWRVDENNTDGTVTKGRVWSFTVADFILIEDFESYDANDNQIWFSWHDGLGFGSPGTGDFFAGNGSGAAVGDENTASFTEETIVHGGFHSMPLFYDNNKQGFAKYSETDLTIVSPRDWTKHGVSVLSLRFRGNPASVGSFTEGPVGTFTMTGSGADITGPADEFHYAYKMLTGPGTIVATVDSVENTNAWAKAGVMIRETLDADSAHAMAFVTPAQGVVFEYRLAAGQDNVGAAAQETGITAPHWVKLERDAAGNFTASHSTNGSSWTPIQSSIPQNISMASTVYIGLALTSHSASQTCEARFSNVSVTGTVGPTWTNQDIGIVSNAAEPLYVALSSSNGTTATVVHDDANASVTDVWTEWPIELSKFADLGVDLTNVDKIAIGLGTQGNTTVPGGSGTLFIDDIRLLRPAPQPQP
ncbi:MAG: LamG domain-containing protein [Phycisphaerae bacterium]|nr:LamG domain-containing protein [Phycisphaerae bacterium]